MLPGTSRLRLVEQPSLRVDSLLLQNKLHRNAGPEDLVATESMLQMIKADTSFSRDFVREFEVFAAELRDFFNAGSFAEMLDGIHPALDEQEQKVIQSIPMT